MKSNDFILYTYLNSRQDMKHQELLTELKELADIYASYTDLDSILKYANEISLPHSYDTVMIKCGYRWLTLHEFSKLCESEQPWPLELSLKESPEIKVNSIRFSVETELKKCNVSVWRDLDSTLFNIALIYIKAGEKPLRDEHLTSVSEIKKCMLAAKESRIYVPLDYEPEEIEPEVEDATEDIQDILEETSDNIDSYTNEVIEEVSEEQEIS